MRLPRRLFGHPRLVLGELVSLAWLAITSMFDLASFGVPDPWAKLLPWAGTTLFIIFVYAHIYSLHSQLTPKLEIVFGNYESCYHRFHNPRAGQPFALYRVGLQNLGGKTIEDPKVSLLKLQKITDDPSDQQAISFGPVRLQFMHEQDSYERLDLHPSDVPTLFVDVVHRVDLGRPGHRIAVQYAVSGIPNQIEPGRYKLTLLAEGLDVPSAQKPFLVDVNEENKLVFGNYESTNQSEVSSS